MSENHKKTMKAKLILLACTCFLGLSLWLAPIAFARDCSNPETPAEQLSCGAQAVNPGGSGAEDSEQAINNTLFQVIRILSLVVGITAIIVIIVQGLRFVLSEGKAETVSSARSGIIYAVIGLVIASLAQALVLVVSDTL